MEKHECGQCCRLDDVLEVVGWMRLVFMDVFGKVLAAAGKYFGDPGDRFKANFSASEGQQGRKGESKNYALYIKQ